MLQLTQPIEDKYQRLTQDPCKYINWKSFAATFSSLDVCWGPAFEYFSHLGTSELRRCMNQLSVFYVIGTLAIYG